MSVAQLLKGVPAGLALPANLLPIAVGTSTITIGTDNVVVANPAIQQGSIIICWGDGLVDATALTFSVDNLIADTSFRISANANATADKAVNWAVLRY